MNNKRLSTTSSTALGSQAAQVLTFPRSADDEYKAVVEVPSEPDDRSIVIVAARVETAFHRTLCQATEEFIQSLSESDLDAWLKSQLLPME